jgi:hypothetical protein
MIRKGLEKAYKEEKGKKRFVTLKNICSVCSTFIQVTFPKTSCTSW